VASEGSKVGGSFTKFQSKVTNSPVGPTSTSASTAELEASESAPPTASVSEAAGAAPQATRRDNTTNKAINNGTFFENIRFLLQKLGFFLE
jgi:hypothetical protein